MKQTVSVVLPAFNVSGYIREALESVWSQSEPADEIIVVDDCSTDDTYEIVKNLAETTPHQPITLIRNPENLGVSATRNRGVASSSGEIIAFLDPDDIWLPFHLAAGRAALSRGADLAFGWLEEFGDASLVSPQRMIRPTNTERRNFPKGYFRRPYIYPSSLFVRRNTFRELEGFPEYAAIGEDWVFVVRAILKGHQVTEIPKVTARLRKHSSSVTAKKFQNMERRLQDSSRVMNEYPVLRKYRTAEYHRQIGYWLSTTKPLKSSGHYIKAISLDPLRLSLWIRLFLVLLIALKLEAIIPRMLRFQQTNESS